MAVELSLIPEEEVMGLSRHEEPAAIEHTLKKADKGHHCYREVPPFYKPGR